MKPSAQLNKGNSSNTKTKKSSKDREKRKSQGGNVEVNNHSTSEKGSPAKESSARLYAGIDADSLINYAEQTAVEHLSEEVTNTLTEDINYRLRYIINDSLVKARLSGRNAISANDIEHTFENLRIEKVYGAPAHPNWIPLCDHSFYCLDDKTVNLVEIAEQENVYHQFAEPILTTTWIPEQKEVGKNLKTYFTTVCQMIVNNDISVRRMALINIGENSRIGPIIEWLYNFGYILLSKDITYVCLTLRALDLIAALENSPTCKVNVSEKQLKLLVRLILQRLLKSPTTREVLKPICNTLALLCRRDPLKQFVILKILQKMDEVFPDYALSVLSITNSLGSDAIQSIVLPNLALFLNRTEKGELPFIYSILESFCILCRETLVDSHIYESFSECFGDAMTIFNEAPKLRSKPLGKRDLNFAHVQCDLLRTRRTLSPREKTPSVPIEEVFELPPENSKVRKKMNDQKRDSGRSQTSVIVGKTTLLLPVFKRRYKNCGHCQDHTLTWCNL